MSKFILFLRIDFEEPIIQTPFLMTPRHIQQTDKNDKRQNYSIENDEER
jgi:hypothetical protein